MTPENFCYWLRGYLEISGYTSITDEQLKEISNHLDLVFIKLTPPLTTHVPYTPFPPNLHTTFCANSVATDEYFSITPGHSC